jgi:Fe-S-cluster containining protein
MQPQDPQQLYAHWRPYAEAARTLGRSVTESALSRGKSAARIDDLSRRLHREFDLMAHKAFASMPGGEAACAPGCDHCCRTLRVTASPVEIFSLSHRLDLHGHPDPALLERILGADSITPLTWRGRSPCPLLVESLCSVYTSRPLACRGCVSADASLCEQCAAYDDTGAIPGSVAHQLGAAAIAMGTVEALAELGLCGQPVELRFGLSLVLRDPHAEKRWLHGEDVFFSPPPPPSA